MQTLHIALSIISFLVRLPFLIAVSIIQILAQIVLHLCSLANLFLVSTLPNVKVSYENTNSDEVKGQPTES